MRVLVTGAGGFVCGNLVTELLKTGHEVIAFDLVFDPALRHGWTTTWGERIRFIEGAVLPRTFNEPLDGLVHGAAITAKPEDRAETPEANLRANLDSLLNMTEWAAAHHVRRVIGISSGAVFGGLRNQGERTLTEVDPVQPLHTYGLAKHTMEQWIAILHTQYGRDAAAVRLSNIYGALECPRPSRPRISLIGQMAREAVTNGRVALRPEAPRDWTFAADIGRAVIVMLEADSLAHTLYHIAAEQVLTQAQIADALRDLLPTLVIDGEADDHHDSITTLSARRFRDEFGFNDWTPLSEGLRQTVEWLHKAMTEAES